LVNTIRDLARQYGVAKREVGRESPLGRDVPSGLVDRSLTPRSLAVSREEQEALENALAGLPADYRRVIELRSRDHRSFKEVGDMMGRSPDATRMLWFRAVERLRGELANHDELGR
jgi:RNA polymerase sigma-70 factor (ECF subfamily)